MRILNTAGLDFATCPIDPVTAASLRRYRDAKRNKQVRVQGLLPNHLDDLLASGLSVETIKSSRLHSVTCPAEISKILNWRKPAEQLGAALSFPFVDMATGEFNCFARLKPDNPLEDRKYEQPRGSQNRAYIPPTCLDAIRDPTRMLGFCEGEKKALAASQSNLPAISIAGIWGWQQKRERTSNGKPIGERTLIDDLDIIPWNGRKVWIGFDFDSRRNPSVNHASAELARILEQHGAIVSIIHFPPGPRQKDGSLSKQALDDFLVRHGRGRLQKFVFDQVSTLRTVKSLSDWREELAMQRIESITRKDINLCRSPTGAGKSHADMAAMRIVSRSLIVLPSHANCREFEEACESKDISAVAYPALTEETCGNYEVAEKAMSSGLSPSQAICPTCKFKETCVYQSDLEIAEKAFHKICTHKRGSMTFDQIAGDRDYIAIHEDSAEFLRPGLQISSGLIQVREVSDAAVSLCKKDHQKFEDPDLSEEYFFRRMSEISDDIAKSLLGNETAVIELPVATGIQRGCDARLWAAMNAVDVWPMAESLQLVKALAAGEIVELVVRVDEVFKRGGEKLVRKSICAVRQTKVPSTSAVWFADATADRYDVESLVGGQAVYDRTPSGTLEEKHPIVQVPLDITKATSKTKVAGMLSDLVSRLPYGRIGVIAHREHVASLKSNDRVTQIAHFRGGESRGSNEWQSSCDCLIVLGTPRVPPSVIRDRLLKLGLPAAMAKKEAEVSWESDYWSGRTTRGNRLTIKTLAYRDHDWHRAHCQIVKSELTQSIGRGRAVTESGIPVIVVTQENLGLRILEIEINSLTESEKEILESISILRDSGNSRPDGSADLSEHFPTGDMQARLSEQSPTIYIVGDWSVSSKSVADHLKKSDRYVRRVLSGLQERQFVHRIGERGGWTLRRPDQIDLYAECGIDRHRSVAGVAR